MKMILAILASAALLAPMLVRANDEGAKYPLTTCVVSGEKLGEMDKPYVFKYEGQEVELCCKRCYKDFSKDPAKYMKKIEEAKKSN